MGKRKARKIMRPTNLIELLKQLKSVEIVPPAIPIEMVNQEDFKSEAIRIYDWVSEQISEANLVGDTTLSHFLSEIAGKYRGMIQKEVYQCIPKEEATLRNTILKFKLLYRDIILKKYGKSID